MLEKFLKIVNRFLFTCAFFVLVIAAWNWLIGLFGWTLKWNPYQSGRLLEFSAVFVIFVIALLLRQIREELKKSNTSS